MALSDKTKIAADIYCAVIQSGHIPDIDRCFSEAGDIISKAKEPHGFFIDIELYKKAISALKIIALSKNEVALKALEDLGESDEK